MQANPHAVMFHHFHSDIHPEGQGSISADDFASMVDWISERCNLISAHEYYEKALSRRLHDGDVCLSFDDGLLCQYDIAAPILDDRKLGAFFFIYSSPMQGEPDLLEVFRYFRTIEFETIDDFYREFFKQVEFDTLPNYRATYERFKCSNYLLDFSFYSENDRWFRYLRDQVMGKILYESTMLRLMNVKNFDIGAVLARLWVTPTHIKELSASNHIVGLHSYSHPTIIHQLAPSIQVDEYKKNMEHLSLILPQSDLTTMAHPCGNYDSVTLDILKSIGIKLGFQASMSSNTIDSLLEMPREDHINIYNRMYS